MHSLVRQERRIFRGLAYDDGGPVWRRTATTLCTVMHDALPAFSFGPLNLFCALGLKGAGDLDPEADFQKLLAWTRHVGGYTRHNLPRYHSAPEKFERSLAKFKMLCMVTALQRDLGVHYHLPFSQGEYNGSDSRNLFIHGILSGHGGACGSLPSLYVAIGRRLGYPLSLVRSKEHWFVRWDGQGERFNVEATSPGFCPQTDEHYHTTPRPLSDAEIKGDYYLRSMTVEEEFACYLDQRGHCLLDNLCLSAAVFAFHLANKLTPNDPNINGGWATASVLYAAVARAVQKLPGKQFAKIDLRTLPMPEPVQEWERWAVPMARRQLDRIIRVTSTDFLFLTRKKRENRDGCQQNA
jgi:hypothetical protein